MGGSASTDGHTEGALVISLDSSSSGRTTLTHTEGRRLAFRCRSEAPFSSDLD